MLQVRARVKTQRKEKQEKTEDVQEVQERADYTDNLALVPLLKPASRID